jgi:hypothetical protein
MSPRTDVLADLRCDLRDVPGVTFAAVETAEAGSRVSLMVTDTSVVDAAGPAARMLVRRHLGTQPWELDIAVAGVPRGPLAVVRALSELPDVLRVEVERGRRGEVLAIRVELAGGAHAGTVRRLVDEQVGSRFRRTRLTVTVLFAPGDTLRP